MKYIISLALLCCVSVDNSYAQKPGDPCCAIVGINTAKGIITSRNTTTGKVQQFKTSPAGISKLQVGDRLTLQGGKITAVNQTGFEPVNEIVSGNQTGFDPVNEITGQVNDGQPCCSIVSLQVNDGEPCCAIVSVKNIATGQLQSFRTMAGIGNTLTLGQSVNLQDGYAMVQSGAGATAAQKGMYAFNVGLDSAGYDLKGNTKVKPNTSETDKWVITPSGLKGATGLVSINLPEGVVWDLDVKSTADQALGRYYNQKTHSLMPGEYNIFFTYLPVMGVPVQKGMNTRLKAGILNVVATGQWSIHDESKAKVYVTYYKPSKIGLPVGKYNIQLGGRYQQVEIKDGEVTEF